LGFRGQEVDEKLTRRVGDELNLPGLETSSEAGRAEASQVGATVVVTMPGGGRGDEAGRATTGARRLATPTEVATYLQVPVRTLYTWRYQRKGPRAHRVGRHLRYRWEDVESWLASEATSG
jgi:excisionase family DNA binding protein